MAKDTKTVVVIAELEVTSQDTTETIKTFDKAWHRALELPVPVLTSFKRWSRID
jgi:hypothetical protein